jgi:CRP-like cAMP-binding protein
MPNRLTYLGGNMLLDFLLSGRSKPDAPELRVVSFKSGDILLDANAPIEDVFFPIDMMISTTTLMQNGAEVEVGAIGREGLSGVQLILGIDHVPGKAICQVAGTAARLSATEFTQWITQSPEASSVMLRYVQATLNALEVSIACNALHPVMERCARWLLVTQDRVQRDEFWLTQEFLAGMLGVRRATVSAVERDLRHLHAIAYTRGHVHILDRGALEMASCECYRLTIDRYDELLRQKPLVKK